MVLIIKQVEGVKKEFKQEIPSTLIRDVIDGHCINLKAEWKKHGM